MTIYTQAEYDALKVTLLDNTAPSYLDLSDKGINDNVLLYIMNDLRSNQSVKRLNLSNNYITNVGANYIDHMLDEARDPMETDLIEIILDGNGITDHTLLDKIAQDLARNLAWVQPTKSSTPTSSPSSTHSSTPTSSPSSSPTSTPSSSPSSSPTSSPSSSPSSSPTSSPLSNETPEDKDSPSTPNDDESEPVLPSSTTSTTRGSATPNNGNSQSTSTTLANSISLFSRTTTTTTGSTPLLESSNAAQGTQAMIIGITLGGVIMLLILGIGYLYRRKATITSPEVPKRSNTVKNPAYDGSYLEPVAQSVNGGYLMPQPQATDQTYAEINDDSRYNLFGDPTQPNYETPVAGEGNPYALFKSPTCDGVSGDSGYHYTKSCAATYQLANANGDGAYITVGEDDPKNSKVVYHHARKDSFSGFGNLAYETASSARADQSPTYQQAGPELFGWFNEDDEADEATRDSAGNYDNLTADGLASSSNL